MSIGSLFGGNSTPNSLFSGRTFGAQVVKSTLNLMNNSQDDQDLSGITDKKTFGAAVVVKTLGFMNSKKGAGPGGSSSLFNLNQNVLGAHFGGKGGIFNTSA